ncbi:hypothetical protein FA13DRAFT_1414627 [Coprinellus micaceus]|uniref:Uncharacterized protein n=1 Tax=Coprinellus micaceus TaxID=71717 RepID=A0A4Y7SNL3_COPMI|nr:hypothetical protein FA13DRAFT_1414627 [Coprinellus micaceus]
MGATCPKKAFDHPSSPSLGPSGTSSVVPSPSSIPSSTSPLCPKRLFLPFHPSILFIHPSILFIHPSILFIHPSILFIHPSILFIHPSTHSPVAPYVRRSGSNRGYWFGLDGPKSWCGLIRM